MQLFKITKQGSLHFKLTDGRIGVCYESGMVRVSVKHSTKRFYQINKQLKVITKSSYFYKRQLITNCVDRVQCLMNFDNNNCQVKPYEYNTKYGR
mgnify:CR=1 FL=1